PPPPPTGARPRRAPPKPGFFFLELKRHIEESSGARFPECPVGKTRQLTNLRREFGSRQRIDGDGCRLPFRQVAAIVVVDLGTNLHAPRFDYVRDRPARTH